MFYDDLLPKACAVLNDRPALKYIYQNPKNGEFVASDGIVMLVERNGSISMFEYWNPQTEEPILDTSSLKYPDYVTVLENAIHDNAYMIAKVKHTSNGLTDIEGFKVSTTNFRLVQSFCGKDMRIKIPDFHTAIYFESSDKNRQALIMPYKIIDNKECEWIVKDVDGLKIGTYKTFKEAESFVEMLGGNYVVRLKNA